MTTEEIILMAREAGLHVFGGDVIEALERFAAIAYAKGQLDMREAAAMQVIFEFGEGDYAQTLASNIRALPIEGENE